MRGKQKSGDWLWLLMPDIRFRHLSGDDKQAVGHKSLGLIGKVQVENINVQVSNFYMLFKPRHWVSPWDEARQRKGPGVISSGTGNIYTGQEEDQRIMKTTETS